MAEAEWCWVEHGLLGEEGMLHGPFGSREDALEDARGSFFDEHLPLKIVLGRVHHVRPEDYPPRYDTHDLLEQMEEALNDGGLCFEDSVFYLKNKHEVANRHLQEALVAWIREWVLCDGWVLAEEGREEAVLEKEAS